MCLDFGDDFAYTGRYAQPGKSSVGEQHGQESLEEIEEDQPDQAFDEAKRVQVSVHWPCAHVAKRCALSGQIEMTKGLPPRGWRPFFFADAPPILPDLLCEQTSSIVYQSITVQFACERIPVGTVEIFNRR
jgi:hypothetical protein